MEKFIQIFRKGTRSSGYRKQALIEEFKRGMDRRIRKRLMEVECPLKSINQWYKRIIRLDRNCRKSRK